MRFCATDRTSLGGRKNNFHLFLTVFPLFHIWFSSTTGYLRTGAAGRGPGAREGWRHSQQGGEQLKGSFIAWNRCLSPSKTQRSQLMGKEQPWNCFHTGKDRELLQLKNSYSSQLLLLCLSTQSDRWVFVPPSQRKQTNKNPQANHKVKALLAIWFISAIGKNYLIQRNFPSCPGVA